MTPEKIIVLGFVSGGIFLLICGAFTDKGLIAIGIGLLTTIGSYYFGKSKGETQALKRFTTSTK